jgi:hypothetical protein
VLNNNSLVGNLLSTGLCLQPKDLSLDKEKDNKDKDKTLFLCSFLVELNKCITGIETIIKSSFGLFLALMKQSGFKSREECKMIIEAIFQVIYTDDPGKLQIQTKNESM